VGKGKEVRSFLKKRTKKLWFSAVLCSGESRQRGKSFLLLFFKKEALPFFSGLDEPQARGRTGMRRTRRG
jgi:hypothetical protein